MANQSQRGPLSGSYAAMNDLLNKTMQMQADIQEKMKQWLNQNNAEMTVVERAEMQVNKQTPSIKSIVDVTGLKLNRKTVSEGGFPEDMIRKIIREELTNITPVITASQINAPEFENLA